MNYLQIKMYFNYIWGSGRSCFVKTGNGHVRSFIQLDVRMQKATST